MINTTVPGVRVKRLGRMPVRTDGAYVLYWMTAYRRTRYNFALQHAVHLANELQKPLLVFEALRCNYRWASVRLHQFVLQGMLDTAKEISKSNASYCCYVEPTSGAGSGLLENLAEKACAVVSDDFPCFFHPAMYDLVAPALRCQFELVDSNAIWPIRESGRLFTVAHSFRRYLQKSLSTTFPLFPLEEPLLGLVSQAAKSHRIGGIAGGKELLTQDLINRYGLLINDQAIEKLRCIDLSSFPIDQSVGPAMAVATEQAQTETTALQYDKSKSSALNKTGLSTTGLSTTGLSDAGMRTAGTDLLNHCQDDSGSSVTAFDVAGQRFTGGQNAALRCCEFFLRRSVHRYGEGRNDPMTETSSGLSPYLHFGNISAHEVFVRLATQCNWTLEKMSAPNGKATGFWNMGESVDVFLDQLITWREIGFNACVNDPKFDRYDSLPTWALRTLADHADDERSELYTLEELEAAKTNDVLWNAGQRQLLREGIMHNYLRMLWGKKILQWSPSPQIALKRMIHLNNKYALDGRDPNSYSGIFWVLGRYDRAWGPERPIFGKIRYMTSDSTLRKFSWKRYLTHYADRP